MKKNMIPFVLLSCTLSSVGIISTKQQVIEKRQPTFAEALQFFQQKAEKKQAPVFEKRQPEMVDNALASQNTALIEEISELKERYTHLQEQHTTLSEQLKQEQAKTATLRTQISEVAQQDTEVDTDSATAEQLAQAVAETVQLHEQVADLTQQLTEATEMIVLLQEKLAEVTQERDLIKRRVQEKEEIITALEEKIGATEPTIPMAAPLPSMVDEQPSVPQKPSDEALQHHLSAIRAGVGLKPVKATTKAKTEAETGLAGALVRGLQKRFGWMAGQEEPEDEWDNEVEEFIQSTP